MSRRKGGKSHKRASSGSTAVVEHAAASVPAASETDPVPVDPRRFRRRLLLVAGAVAAWWAVLIALVLLTANPVTLNRRQLRNSSRIVTAEVIDAAAGKVRVVRDFRGENLQGEFRVDNLDEAGVRNGNVYILPLSLTASGSYHVTPVAELPQKRLIYPATDDAVQQLEQFLASRRKR